MSWLNGRAVEQLNSSISIKLFKLSTIKLKNLFTTHNSQFIKKLFAFTLAETLIVMGVIGIVAALTLPNLNSSTGNKEKVAKLQKIYSNLNDAVGRATAVYGPIDTWCTGLTDANCQKRHFERITEFMKYSKSCTISSCLGRFDTNGDATSDGQETQYGVVLADGATIGFGNSQNIHVDLDGLNKGANKHGVDYFVLRYNSDRGVYYNTVKSGSPDSHTYRSTAWVLENGNMDYLKCPTKLSFGGTITCK